MFLRMIWGHAEVSGYGSLTPRAQTTLRFPPNLTFNIDGVAPYWCLAVEPNWGEHSFMVVFGMSANIRPNRTFGSEPTKSPTLESMRNINGLAMSMPSPPARAISANRNS